MDLSEASNSNNGNTSPSSQRPPHESSNTFNDLDADLLLIGADELESMGLTPPFRDDFPPENPFFDSGGMAEDKVPIQDPYDNYTKKLSLLSEETIHEENPAYVYEPRGKMQNYAHQLAFHDSNAQASEEHGAPKRNWHQFGEAAAWNAHGSNNSTISSLHIPPEEPQLSAGGRTFPAELSEPYQYGMYSNTGPTVPFFATADVGLSQCLGSTQRMQYIFVNSSPANDGKSSGSAHNISSTINERRRDENGVSRVAAANFWATENHPSLMEPSSSCHPSVHHGNKKVTSPGDDEENSEKAKLNQQPESKKKKGPQSTGTGDSKGCNCKKSACLKLHCHCFAAERHCDESCRCQDCSNKEAHRDKIDACKKQIKSRNKLAFAPKIVQKNGTDIPSNNNTKNDHLKTPSSSQHRSGCKCRESRCKKNYCECYKGKVGCSSGCRCEGCENSFGKKEEHVAGEQHLPSRERVENGSNSSNAELGDNPYVPSLPMPCPTPPLPRSDVRQSSSVSLSYQIRHHVLPPTVTPPASISGASLGWSQISHQSHMPPLFRDPLHPHTTPTLFPLLPNIWEQPRGRFIAGRGKLMMKSVASFTRSNPSNPKDKDPSQGANGP